MHYWLIKSEPFVFSFDDLIRDGKAIWDGVRNYQARNNLRLMQSGDCALFYHSNEGLEIVGVCQVIRTHYPDPTAEKGDWSAVDFAPLKKLNNPVSLSSIKADPKLQNIGLVRNGRLSVMPLTKEEFHHILKMSDTTIMD